MAVGYLRFTYLSVLTRGYAKHRGDRFSRVDVQNNGHSLAHSVISSRNVVAVSSLAYRIFELVPRRLTLRLENYDVFQEIVLKRDDLF